MVQYVCAHLNTSNEAAAVVAAPFRSEKVHFCGERTAFSWILRSPRSAPLRTARTARGRFRPRRSSPRWTSTEPTPTARVSPPATRHCEADGVVRTAALLNEQLFLKQFWRVRSRLYRSRFLRLNMHFAFLKTYTMHFSRSTIGAFFYTAPNEKSETNPFTN